MGQDKWEEVDVQPRGVGGRNYGWSLVEGDHRYKGAPPPGAIPPLLEYSHDNGACAVIGGVVDRASGIAALNGAYLYADFCAGWIRAVREGGGRVVEQRDLGLRLNSPSGFGVDHAGRLYVLSLTGAVDQITG